MGECGFRNQECTDLPQVFSASLMWPNTCTALWRSKPLNCLKRISDW
uniref:Uncharacterized protein n=1 Tax=Anguilla anguilla TaxID=7936 RepID=A0A0E9RAI1_ANGAN